jgi:hypothetical protein
LVWTLRHLFTGPYAGYLVFKGGTSLSKGYGVIRRFSEDVDLTYDIREIAGDLVGHAEAPLSVNEFRRRSSVVYQGGQYFRAGRQDHAAAGHVVQKGLVLCLKTTDRAHAVGEQHNLAWLTGRKVLDYVLVLLPSLLTTKPNCPRVAVKQSGRRISPCASRH